MVERKQARAKRGYKIIKIAILPLLAIVLPIIFSGNGKKIGVAGDNNGIATNSIETENFNYENNVKPTQIEEENAEYNQILRNKIHSFFENLDQDKEYQARNNVYKNLSWKFTENSVHDFCRFSNSLFVKEIFNDGPINNDKKIVSNIYDVKIEYNYTGNRYEEVVNVKVRLDPSDIEEKEIHISEVKCFDINQGPFCKMFGY